AVFHGAQSTSGRICTDYGGVKVVDVSNPASPQLLTTITVEDNKGATARGGVKFNNVSDSVSAVDALRINTPTFAGDVLAFSTQRCEMSFFTGARIEFWDVTNPATPVRLGVFDPETIANPTPGGTPANGAWGIFEDVQMFTRGGKVYAVATTPFSIGNTGGVSFFGDFRLIDITDIRKPTQIGTFPPVSIGQDSVNGCRTFLAGRGAAPTPDGSGAIFSFYDGSSLFGVNSASVFKLDLDSLPTLVPASSPPQFTPNPPTFGYPPNPTVEGNAADVEPFFGPTGGLLSFVSEDDLDPAVTSLVINGPSTAAGNYRACTQVVGTKVYESAGQQIAGNIVYVGRGCPAIGGTNTAADAYLADPAGKVVVVDGGGCTAIQRLERAAAAGARAIIHSSGSQA
ncbi:MAG: hypothetical protein ACRD0D_09245, partial [Acidimicrobiales bacterium]